MTWLRRIFCDHVWSFDVSIFWQYPTFTSTEWPTHALNHCALCGAIRSRRLT